MTELEKAARQALEALEQWNTPLYKRGNVITALSRALEQQPAKEKASQSANCEAPGRINSDHARRDDCTTRQPAQQQEPTVEDNSQEWRGMDGTTAYWLIQRHADGWPDIGKMMGEWLEANQTQPAQQQCNPHPKAPHGFDRNASHSADRYVCECEGWDAYEAGYQAGIEKALELDAEPQPAQGCEFCSHPLYAGTKCKNCGCERPAYRAVKTVHEGKAYYVSEPEQPAQQEPVAWVVEDEHGERLEWAGDAYSGRGLPTFPLYTSPSASKPWVGLTDVEWMNIVNKDHAWFGQRPEDVAHEVAKLVEAKLKEKNNG